MSTVRSLIVAALKLRLETAGFFVSRKLHALADLREDQLPGISILNGPQRDEPGSMGDDVKTAWDLSLIVYVKDMVTETPQEVIDEAMATAAKAITKDGTLGGLAMTVDSLSRDTDRGTYFPFASAEMVFRIQFFYDRQTQGG
jgi:hypothetical protein